MRGGGDWGEIWAQMRGASLADAEMSTTSEQTLMLDDSFHWPYAGRGLNIGGEELLPPRKNRGLETNMRVFKAWLLPRSFEPSVMKHFDTRSESPVRLFDTLTNVRQD